MTTRRILLACGLLSSLLYAAMLILIPLQWEAYQSSSWMVSELSAIGAPTRPLWAGLAVVYGLLLGAFAIGVWRSAERSRALRVVGGLLLASAVAGFFWPPMHLRETLAAGGGTATDTGHLVVTFVWALLSMTAMGFGAAAFGWTFRGYTIASAAIMIVFGVLNGRAGPAISAGLPTPWAGVWERIIICSFMLWLAVLALLLLTARETARPPAEPTRRGRGSGDRRSDRAAPAPGLSTAR